MAKYTPILDETKIGVLVDERRSMFENNRGMLHAPLYKERPEQGP